MPCTRVLWLSAPHSSQPLFPMGTGGIAIQYSSCWERSVCRSPYSKWGMESQAAQGCMFQRWLPSAHNRSVFAVKLLSLSLGL